MALVWDDNLGQWVEDGTDAGPVTSARRFNPSANWADTNTAPNPTDPYYQQWREANPGIPESQAEPVGRQIKSHNSGGTQYYDGASDGPGGNTYSGPKDFKSIVNWWQKNHPGSNPDMDGLVKVLNENGLSVSRARHANNTLTSEDKLIFDGKTWDIGSSLGSGSGSWFFDFGPEGDETGGTKGPRKFTGEEPGIDPRLLTPWTEPTPRKALPPTFTPPAWDRPESFASKPFDAPAPFSYPELEAPDPFKAPTLEEAKAEPGYQFAVDQGLKALQQSAAAKGVLRTGGSLKDLINYGQSAAEGNYQNVFERGKSIYNTNLGAKFQTYDTNRNNAFQNYGMNFNNSLAAHGVNAQQELSDYLTNYGVHKDAFDYLYRGESDKHQSLVDLNKTDYDRAMGDYDRRRQIDRENKTDIFNRYKTLIDLGLM